MARYLGMSRDDVEVATFWEEDGVLHRVHTSPNEGQIMALNAQVRSAGGARKLTFGRMILQMSFAQWLVLRKRYPALASKDHQERTAAWLKIANDPAYRALSVKGD